MAQTVQMTLVNGIDTQRLTSTVDELREKPDMGRFQFHVRNRWLVSTHNRTEIEGFYGAGEERRHPNPFVADNDEPHVLLGEDSAPNPAEWVLHALAGCVTTTMMAHAAARGIRIDACETDIEGDIDVRGFMGVASDVPRGFQKIRVRMHVKSDASPEQLKELAQMSPVFNTLKNPLDVELSVERA